MNLARHASVLWRFRRVTAGGVVLGVVLAILGSYHVSPSGLTPRGSETWSAVSSILVTQPGFPEGRVTLPESQIDSAVTSDGQQAVEPDAAPKDQVEFADPARLAGLGDLYSKFLTSDEVLSRVPEHPTAAQVMASPFAGSQGGLLLPVVQLTTLAQTGPKAQRLNLSVYKALRGFMDEQAAANHIVRAKRVELKLLVAPEVSLASGPKPTASVLAFLLVLLGTVAVTHLLEALRTRREAVALASIEWDTPGAGFVDEPDDMQEHYANNSSQPAEIAGRRSKR
jgi:hypothetical protein